MPRLMNSLILASIICLNIGCNKIVIPKKIDEERCVVSIYLDKCRCHSYRVSEHEVGRVSESVDHPLIYCDNLVGFKPTSWVRYVSWFEEIFETADDANKNNLVKPKVETKKEINQIVWEMYDL